MTPKGGLDLDGGRASFGSSADRDRDKDVPFNSEAIAIGPFDSRLRRR